MIWSTLWNDHILCEVMDLHTIFFFFYVVIVHKQLIFLFQLSDTLSLQVMEINFLTGMNKKQKNKKKHKWLFFLIILYKNIAFIRYIFVPCCLKAFVKELWTSVLSFSCVRCLSSLLLIMNRFSLFLSLGFLYSDSSFFLFNVFPLLFIFSFFIISIHFFILSFSGVFILFTWI